MNNHRLKPSELKLLFRNDGTKYYRWICFLRDGKFLLESTINKQEVVGKVLTDSSEGELHIWPQLQHENINRLLEVLCLNDFVKILISPFVGRSIGTLIYDDNFNEHPLCFERKKSYAKGILSALSYMHENSVFHLNLNDENIAICSYTDKAVLCDFSYAVSRREVPRSLLPPKRHLAPEVYKGIFNDFFDIRPIDIWDCGILFLEIFTQHQYPWHNAVKESLEIIDIDILKKTNSGANLRKEAVGEFRIFMQHLLSENPKLRPTAEEALQSCFLQKINNRLDVKAKHFWKNKISDLRIENHHLFDVESISDVNIDSDFKQLESGKARLTWTKSEPDRRYYREEVNPTLPGYASSPALQKNIDAENADSRKKNHQGEDLEEWNTANIPNMEKDLSYFLYSESQVDKEEEFSKCPSCNLDQMIPYIISMNGLNLDDSPPVSNNSSSKISKESLGNSEPNISKVGLNEWIDVPLQNNHKVSHLESNIGSNDKIAKEETVSKKKRRELSSGKPPSKAFQRPGSPKLIDKQDLYEKSETKMALDVESCRKGTRSPRRKKWYHKLCPGFNTKKAR